MAAALTNIATHVVVALATDAKMLAVSNIGDMTAAIMTAYLGILVPSISLASLLGLTAHANSAFFVFVLSMIFFFCFSVVTDNLCKCCIGCLLLSVNDSTLLLAAPFRTCCRFSFSYSEVFVAFFFFCCPLSVVFSNALPAHVMQSVGCEAIF